MGHTGINRIWTNINFEKIIEKKGQIKVDNYMFIGISSF